jgi:hypothetical protein
MCVKLGSTGEIVCCTDLECTAAVISGTTSYVSTSERAFSTSTRSPVITSAPTVTAQATSIVGPEEWHWTVTW